MQKLHVTPYYFASFYLFDRAEGSFLCCIPLEFAYQPWVQNNTFNL